MILFFSGTGNSQYVAKILAEKTKDDIVSINKLVKQGNQKQLVSQDKPLVFVCPTYAWRIPKVVEDFIKSVDFSGSNKVYFILTCGLSTSNALGYIKQLCKVKGFELEGFADIIMPENYIAMYNAPDKVTADKIIQKSMPKILKIAEDIRDEIPFPVLTTKPSLKSGVVNTVFYKFFVKSKGFYTTEKCISCKKCVQLCPLNNIEIKEDKPIWQNNCTHCMACISGCPTLAIEYKNKTQGKPRYYLECK